MIGFKKIKRKFSVAFNKKSNGFLPTLNSLHEKDMDYVIQSNYNSVNIGECNSIIKKQNKMDFLNDITLIPEFQKVDINGNLNICDNKCDNTFIISTPEYTSLYSSNHNIHGTSQKLRVEMNGANPVGDELGVGGTDEYHECLPSKFLLPPLQIQTNVCHNTHKNNNSNNLDTCTSLSMEEIIKSPPSPTLQTEHAALSLPETKEPPLSDGPSHPHLKLVTNGSSDDHLHPRSKEDSFVTCSKNGAKFKKGHHQPKHGNWKKFSSIQRHHNSQTIDNNNNPSSFTVVPVQISSCSSSSSPRPRLLNTDRESALSPSMFVIGGGDYSSSVLSQGALSPSLRVEEQPPTLPPLSKCSKNRGGGPSRLHKFLSFSSSAKGTTHHPPAPESFLLSSYSDVSTNDVIITKKGKGDPPSSSPVTKRSAASRLSLKSLAGGFSRSTSKSFSVFKVAPPPPNNSSKKKKKGVKNGAIRFDLYGTQPNSQQPPPSIVIDRSSDDVNHFLSGGGGGNYTKLPYPPHCRPRQLNNDGGPLPQHPRVSRNYRALKFLHLSSFTSFNNNPNNHPHIINNDDNNNNNMRNSSAFTVGTTSGDSGYHSNGRLGKSETTNKTITNNTRTLSQDNLFLPIPSTNYISGTNYVLTDPNSSMQDTLFLPIPSTILTSGTRYVLTDLNSSMQEEISKRLSLPVDIHIPEGFLVRNFSQPLLNGPLSRKDRRDSLYEIGFGRSDTYTKLDKIGEGTYATVYRGKSRLTDTLVALKEIRLEYEEGAPCTAIREVSLLKNLKHANIVTLHDIIHTKTSLTLVFEYLEKDLKQYMDDCDNILHMNNIKLFMFQLLRGLEFCHRKQILHRDLKPQNLLINKIGELKLADFGLARAKSVPTKTYSNEVVTLWYRPPEVLLGSTEYSTPIDMWGVGCIFFEMVGGKPLFPGSTVDDQLRVIWQALGHPPHHSNYFATYGTPANGYSTPGLASTNKKDSSTIAYGHMNNLKLLAPRLDRDALHLISRFLDYDPKSRISARSAIRHQYFKTLPESVYYLPEYTSIFALPNIKLSKDPGSKSHNNGNEAAKQRRLSLM